MLLATPERGAPSTAGTPLFTDCGTMMSLGTRQSAFICSVRSTSPTSNPTRSWPGSPPA